MTIWEWLAILVLVAGFATVLGVGAGRAPVVDNARVMKNQLEEIDRAIREAEAAGKRPDDGQWAPGEYLPLLRDKHARLRESGLDPFGNPYGPVPAGGRPEVPAATQSLLAGTLDVSFWSPFRVQAAVPADPPR
jgi:hypothetical protein